MSRFYISISQIKVPRLKIGPILLKRLCNFQSSLQFIYLVQLDLLNIKIILELQIKMEEQKLFKPLKSKNAGCQKGEISKQTKFITLNSQYHFRHSISLHKTLNKNKNTLFFHGQLIYNNGQIVPISINHNDLIKKYLNSSSQKVSQSTIMFLINDAMEALQYVYKIIGVQDLQKIQKISQKVERQIIGKKRSIITILSIIGKISESQTTLMRKILIQKKKLKIKITNIFQNKNNSQITVQKINICSTKNADFQQNGIILLGQNSRFSLLNDPQIRNQKDMKKYEGGYFVIEDTPYIIYDNQQKMALNQRIVQKSLKQNRKNENNSKQILKVQHELNIIRQINDKSFLIRYYLEGNNVFMDKYDHSLHEYVQYMGDSLSIAHKIAISKQIIQAVISLHESNIVHRDIKGSNFLINDQNNIYQLKIIDFAQSYCGQLELASVDYACSLPYSPLQCSERKSIVNGIPQEGLCKKQIDYWSVGLAIYEVFFRKLPISFSRTFLYDIQTSWKNELLLAVDQREKLGFHVIQDIITIICIKMMKYKQQQRMNLRMAKELMCQLEIYYNNLLNIIQQHCS